MRNVQRPFKSSVYQWWSPENTQRNANANERRVVTLVLSWLTLRILCLSGIACAWFAEEAIQLKRPTECVERTKTSTFFRVARRKPVARCVRSFLFHWRVRRVHGQDVQGSTGSVPSIHCKVISFGDRSRKNCCVALPRWRPKSKMPLVALLFTITPVATSVHVFLK